MCSSKDTIFLKPSQRLSAGVLLRVFVAFCVSVGFVQTWCCSRSTSILLRRARGKLIAITTTVVVGAPRRSSLCGIVLLYLLAFQVLFESLQVLHHMPKAWSEGVLGLGVECCVSCWVWFFGVGVGVGVGLGLCSCDRPQCQSPYPLPLQFVLTFVGALGRGGLEMPRQNHGARNRLGERPERA